MTTVYQVDPLGDARWEVFLQRHPRASIFHTSGWLEALRRTYGYRSVVLTTTPPGTELANGLVFCLVDSWLTGRRLVSLPFSDHCDPLVATSEEFADLLQAVERLRNQEKSKSIEIRPLDGDSLLTTSTASFQRGECFYFHRLDLRPNLNELYQRFHKDCVQRKIRRAEREELTYQDGRSEQLLRWFYHLLMLTRRRHQLPPQPLEWFRNLVDCMGENIKIRVTSKDSEAIAAIITLSFKQAMIYKYGCSDARYHNLGAMPFLYWKAIQEAKRHGATEVDLGRSDLDNPGLIAFKDRWAASRSTLTYWRYPGQKTETASNGWMLGLARHAFSHMPDRLLAATGKLLYRQIG